MQVATSPVRYAYGKGAAVEFRRKKAAISLASVLPEATDNTRASNESSDGKRLWPLSRRNTRAATAAVRLLPSENGWF